MDRPEGFEDTFNRAALKAANDQAQRNIQAISSRMASEQAAVEQLKQQESFLRRSNPVPLEELKRVCDTIMAKKAGIAAFNEGIANLQRQQNLNNLYVEYIDYLKAQGAGV